MARIATILLLLLVGSAASAQNKALLREAVGVHGGPSESLKPARRSAEPLSGAVASQ
jgi:hypothetical protein